MLWIVLCVTLAVVESGDWSAIIKAQQLFHEVYGKKMEAAKTPEAKAALAKELLELAKKETDQLAKRVELEEAKRLAIEAEAAALAFDIVRAWVETFPETSLSQTELLERAELLWKEAETKKGIEKLSWQTDAIEMWLQSRTTSGLLSRQWEARIDRVFYDPVTQNFLRLFNGRWVAIVNRKSGLTINVAGGSSQVGARLIQWPDPINNSNSIWRVVVVSSSSCRFQNLHTSLWLGVVNGRPTQVPLDSDNEQHSLWQISSLQRDRSFVLVHRYSGLALGPENDGSEKGVSIVLRTPDEASASCRWFFVVIR